MVRAGERCRTLLGEVGYGGKQSVTFQCQS